MHFETTSIAVAIYATNWILWGVALITVALRFVARSKRHIGPRIDDYLMVLGLICNFMSALSSSLSVSHGIGTPIQIVSSYPSELSKAIYWSDLATLFGLYGIGFPKVAIGLLVNHIFVPRTWIRIVNLLVVTILMVILIATTILLYVQCTPVSHGWDPAHVPGTCLSSSIFANVGLAAGAWDSFTDVYFILYPTWVISKLNMALRKKILAAVTMGLGIFTLFTTLYKTAAILPTLNEREADVTSIMGKVIMWTSIEANVTVIAGSIPTWAWLVKTEVLEYFITRFSLTSLRSPKGGQELDSNQDSEGRVRDFNAINQLETADDRRPGQTNKTGIDSVVLIERSANR